MKRKKMSNLLLRNYLLLYFIMTLILIISIIVAVIIGAIFTKDSVDGPYLAKDIIVDDYKKIDASNILNANGWIEIVDNDLNVIYRKGNSKNKFDTYSKENFYSILTKSSEEEYSDSEFLYSVAYNKNKDFILITAVPNKLNLDLYIKDKKIKPKIFFNTMLIFYILCLIVSLIIYSRITSNTFLVPLEKLMEGVKKLAEGDYSVRISLKSKNEFGALKDAFNLMAEKIEEEKKLKEKSEETRRRLVMDISHDLKNPLASVIGYSDFLLKNSELCQEDRNKYLTIIQSNSIRVDNLVKDLFEFSKFESTNLKITLKNDDICEFLRTLIATYIPQMEDKGIIYDFDIPEESILIPFNAPNLDRALGNILVNGIKYNAKGTTLEIYAKKSCDNFQITIKDNGIGMPKELSKNIFEPFVRVDTSRNSKTGGTGLGLAITKTIIEKHHGSITLDTDLGKGCEFTILLKL